MPRSYLRLAVSTRAPAFACLSSGDRAHVSPRGRLRGHRARRRLPGLPDARRRACRGRREGFHRQVERRRRRRGRPAHRRPEGGRGRPAGEPARPRRRERPRHAGRGRGVRGLRHRDAVAALADPPHRRLGVRLDAAPAQVGGRVARALVAQADPPEARRRDPARDHDGAEGTRRDPRPGSAAADARADRGARGRRRGRGLQAGRHGARAGRRARRGGRPAGAGDPGRREAAVRRRDRPAAERLPPPAAADRPRPRRVDRRVDRHAGPEPRVRTGAARRRRAGHQGAAREARRARGARRVRGPMGPAGALRARLAPVPDGRW